MMFDCGDGASLDLSGKLLRLKKIFITHADRDHINGLPQALNMLGSSGPEVFYPPGSGSFAALKRFLDVFDPETCAHATWTAFEPGQKEPLSGDWMVEAFKTQHFLSDDQDRHRSLGYLVSRVVQKLRSDLRGLEQEEIDLIREDQGREAIQTEVIEPYYIVSGDTVPLSTEQIGATPYLVHECTFLDGTPGGRMGDHSVLPNLLDSVMQAPLKKLLLYHISQRFDPEAGRASINEECRQRGIRFPVAAVFAGETVDDGFAQTVYEP